MSKNHEKLHDTLEKSYKDIGKVKNIFFIKKSILFFFFREIGEKSEKIDKKL